MSDRNSFHSNWNINKFKFAFEWDHKHNENTKKKNLATILCRFIDTPSDSVEARYMYDVCVQPVYSAIEHTHYTHTHTYVRQRACVYCLLCLCNSINFDSQTFVHYSLFDSRLQCFGWCQNTSKRVQIKIKNKVSQNKTKMSDIKSDIGSEAENGFVLNSSPQSVQEFTIYVS